MTKGLVNMEYAKLGNTDIIVFIGFLSYNHIPDVFSIYFAETSEIPKSYKKVSRVIKRCVLVTSEKIYKMRDIESGAGEK